MSGKANIFGWLVEMAEARIDQAALVNPHDRPKPYSMSFGALVGGCNQRSQELVAKGIGTGTRVALMIPPGALFVEYTFALFSLGAVPVLIDPGMGLRGIKKCLDDCAPSVFLGSLKAHVARVLFGWGRKSIRRKMIARDMQWFEYDYEPFPSIASCTDSDLAAILFTSGSTGPAKGAVYTHGMFQEQVRLMREVFGIEPGEVDLCTFPLFALFAPALGMTSIVPDMDPTRPAKADPKKLIKAIFDYKVTNLFGSPALIDVLCRYGEKHDIKLPSLRRVISAGAPVSATVIERMTRMLNPGVQVFTPYGATEALPIAVIGSDEILSVTRHKTDQGAGICVGRPVGRIEVRIMPIDDGPMQSIPDPCQDKGEICVRGPVVSRTYWNRPDADALHKIPDGDTVWHRTGDIGYFDGAGRLWFCGRKAHRVVLPDQTLFTIPVEAVFNAHPDVFRTALVGAIKKGVKWPVLCVELEKECRRMPKDIVPELEAIRERFPLTSPVRDFLFHAGFPVDIRHNAKINREKLAIWAARRLR